ncbi:MAG: hypothetical protein MUF04_02190, partial [Akkermansiaceae bacterium]|nr:hypothetical protein [Akkermansiaceae bacterium]
MKKVIRFGMARIRWIPLVLLGGLAARAADFTSPTLGSLLTDPADLRVENVTVLAETLLADGSTLLEVRADLRNLDTGVWSSTVVGVDAAANAGRVAGLPLTSTAGEVAAGAVASGVPPLHVVVAAADVAAARAEILAGTILQVSGRTAGGVPVDGTSLALENIQIVQEVTLANGRVLMLFTADVRNLLTEAVAEAMITVDQRLGSPDYDFALAGLEFPGIAAEAFTPAPGPGAFYITAAAAELTAVRAEILSGALIEVKGTELFVFGAPPHGRDQATEDAWESATLGAPNEVVLVFGTSTPFLASLQAGDLLVEDPGVNRLASAGYDDPFNPYDDNPPKVLADYLPLEVAAVATDNEGKVRVTGVKRQLLEIVKSATFYQDSRTSPYDAPVRDPYNPLLENTYTAAERDLRAALAETIAQSNPRDGRLADLRGMNGKPWHFNQTPLSPKVSVTGELLLRSSGLKLEIKIRNFQLQRATARVEVGAIANLVIECSGGEDTALLGTHEKSARLFNFQLPGVTFNIGGVPVKVAPLLFLDAGVEASIPQSLTLPLQSAFIIGMDLGWDRSRVGPGEDGFFYEPITEFIPLRVSDPTVFDEAAASLEAWAELGVAMVGNIVPLGISPRGIANLGPSLTARASANFTLAPLADPWWDLDFDIDLTGNFAMDILGETLIDTDIPLVHYELPEYDRDAGGPLFSMAPLPTPPSNSTIRPLAAKNVRWARLYQPRNSFGGLANGFVAYPGADGSFVIGGDSVVGYSTLAKFNTEGDLLWARDMGIQRLVKLGAGVGDGSVVTVGNRGTDLVLSRFDADGNRTWVKSLAPSLASYTITKVAVARDSLGDPLAIYLCGFVNQGTVTESDPLLLKFDLSGNLLWSVIFPNPGDDELYGITVLADGNLLLAGFTAANVAPAPQGTPDPYNAIKDATRNALLLKVAAADGAMLWAQAYASLRGMTFSDAVEAPDGTLFAGGKAERIITERRPVNLFAKLTPDGVLRDHVLVGDDPDLPDEMANGGNTPYDNVTRIQWTPEGLLACGNTGLGTGQAGWIMGLTDELGVRFYSVIDGAHTDTLFDVAAGPDGIALLASTFSMMPWGASGTPLPLVVKLPWEGIMRFHEDLGVRTFVLPPQVYHSSVDPDFQMLSSTTLPGGGIRSYTNVQSPAPLTASAVAWSTGGTPGTPAEPPALMLLAVEAVEAAQIQGFAGWAAYHQLTGADALGTSDIDEDGLVNAFEAYFGLNPRRADHGSPMQVYAGEPAGQPVLVLEFERASYAGSLGIGLETSIDLSTWDPATGLTELVEPLSADRQRVRILAPASDPARFF